MFEFQPISYNDRAKFYSELQSEIEGLMERAWFTNLSNASAALMAHLPRLNWAGFYLLDPETKALVLGPFQGLPACLRIPVGKGVCGAAAERRETVVVDDVHAFPGHIACDARSRSEIVVPMIDGQGRILGVLDLDSPEVGRFDGEDARGLEVVVRAIIERTTWPASFL